MFVVQDVALSDPRQPRPSAVLMEPSDPSIDTLRAVDPTWFRCSGQWAGPLDGWTEEGEDHLDAATWMPILKATLDELPPRQRHFVVLRDVEGLPTTEACAVLGTSVGNQRSSAAPGTLTTAWILEAKMEKS